jgi:phosphohistidine swiveling domain-containing protein
MKKELKFEKMWEAANTYVFDIDTGSILPILVSLEKVSGFSDSDWMFYFKNEMGSAYYEMSNMNQAKLVGNKNFTDSKFLEDYFSGIDNVLEQQTDLFKKIEKTDFDKLDNKEIKNILTKSVNLIVENFGYYLACQPQYVSKLEEEIQNELKDFIPESKISDVFSLLSTPTENTKIRQEEIDWLDLLINSKKENVSLEDEIKKHHSKYFLLNAADGQEPFSVDYYIKKFEEDSKNTLGSLEEKKEEIYLGIDEIKNNKKTVINKYLIDQGLVEKCKILSKVGHARLEMRIVGWMPGYYYNQFIINEISKRFDYSSKELRFLTVDEIYNLLDGILVSKNIISDRMKAFLFIVKEKKSCVLSDSEAIKKFEELVKQEDLTNIKEIHGKVAMTGKVTGRVVIFKWTDNMEEKIKQMGEDSILVTGQTRPQIMPLITKSKAIVTDEGGITSHAAIVSRELKIPCVIGTKIATQALNDGDQVEVDANNGIVKKL